MSIAQDVKYTLRLLRQTPVFTAVAVCSLALGIGANTAIFTLVNAVLLRWLPVPNPQELVVLARNPSRTDTSFNYPDYCYLRDHNQSYSGVVAFSNGGNPTSFRLAGSQASTQLVAMSMVSGNYFEGLGVTPAIGRLFNPADNEKEGAHPYVVLSHGFWTRTFGNDTGAVGRDVMLNGARFQVIGVSREGFTGASVGISPDVFVPIMMLRTFNPRATSWNSRHYWFLTALARLKPGVTRNAAGAEMNVLWHRILDSDPEHKPPAAWDKQYQLENTGLVLPGSGGYSYMRNETSKPLVILMITTGIVLIIACANVASLLLARSAGRQREIAVRLALGAQRLRLVTQLLTESITLSILGGLAGIAVAWAGVRVLLGFFPRGAFPVHLNLSPDLRVLGFSLGLCLLTGVVFGLAPALRASRPDLIPALKLESGATEQGRGRGWSLQRILVSFQVALALILLAGAGLFVRTLGRLRDLDPGMNRQNLLFISTNLGQLGYQPQRQREFEERLRDNVQRMPGVMAASFANITPLGGSRWNNDVQVEGYHWRPDEPPYIDMNGVLPRYFETAGIPILLGRDFRDSDNAPVLPDRPKQAPKPEADPPDVPGPPRVVIVNEAFARKFFAGRSPLGRRICFGDKWNPAKTVEIVGLVHDAYYFDLKQKIEPMIYQPAYREAQGGGGELCVRTTGDANRLTGSIRQRMQTMDNAVVITEAHTMEDNLNRNLVLERFVATLGGFFGIVSLLLAAVGLYGVMSYTVARRTREIGIRMALGAEARGVLWLVLRDAALTVLIGAGVGTAAALLLTRYTESMLFGIKPNDPATLAAAFAALLCVTALAAFLPAFRATRVEPVTTLRSE